MRKGKLPEDPEEPARARDPFLAKWVAPMTGYPSGLVRLGLSLFAAAVYGLWGAPVPHEPSLAWAGIAGAVVYSGILLAIDPGEEFGGSTAAWVVSGADAVLVTIFLMATGGWESPWFPLWYLSAFGLGLRFGAEETLVASTGYMVLYAGIAVWDGALLPNSGIFVVRMGFLYALGALGIVVSTTLLEESIERREYEDLAEQRAYEASLLESTLEATEDGIAVVERDGEVVLWNDRFAHLTEVPPGVLEEGGWAALEHFADRIREPGPEAFQGRVREILEDREKDSYDQLKLDDGRLLELYSSPQHLDELVGRVWTLRDVTESTRLRERLEERERQYRDLFEHVPVGLFEMTPDRETYEVNETLLEILGYEDQEALREVGDRLWVDPGSRKSFVERIREEGRVESFETPLRRADGETIVVQIEGESVDRREGQPLIRGAMLDVTERKRMERELRDYARRLEESNEDLEQFASAVSHDLRTPLGGVLGHLDLVEPEAREELSDDAVESFEHAMASAERMDEMIRDLLAFARIDPNREAAEEVDPAKALEDAEGNLSHLVEEEDATVEHGDLPPVRANRSHLLTIFQNLLSNAIRYRGDEPPRIRVDGKRVGDGMVRVEVEDNGEGIPPEVKDRIFGLFAQGPNRQEEGTGTGLATCERIVRRYGGEIGVDSTVGEGSTFWFTLPAPGDSADGPEDPIAGGQGVDGGTPGQDDAEGKREGDLPPKGGPPGTEDPPS